MITLPHSSNTKIVLRDFQSEHLRLRYNSVGTTGDVLRKEGSTPYLKKTLVGIKDSPSIRVRFGKFCIRKTWIL